MAHSGRPGDAPAVAVLGTGIMGSAMARNILRAGFRTIVWDRTREKMEPLVQAGAVGAGSAREAVHEARVVITMLATADAINSVIFDQGAIEAFVAEAIWAQMATIGVEAILQMRDRVGAVRPDVTFVDAPVSGTRGPAEHGQLTILASGPERAATPLGPVFSALGHKIIWLGRAGQGSRMKTVINAYLAILIEGVAEMAELADRLGVTHAELSEVLDGSPLAAPVAMAKLRKIFDRDFEPEFPLEWALKDVDLAVATARDASLPLLAALSRQWHAAVEEGLGPEDVSAARLALEE